jgi:cyclic beta-1,2-glucan synthetase
VLDEETIVRFVCAFQTVTPLTMGEVWALPIMLCLVLVDNLQRIAAQMLSSRACAEEARRLAQEWDQKGTISLDFCDISSNIAECGGLVVCLIEELQGTRPELAERLRELERRLEEQQITAHQVIHRENQRQAANQVSIGNVITSMRLISALDWVAFFERTSLTEQVLRTDPAGVYSQMDFDSRDRYRHVVERIAKGCHSSETDVAEVAVKLATRGKEEVERHVGYWLADAGLTRLETEVDFRPRMRHRIMRAMQRNANATYLGLISLLTLLGVAPFVVAGINIGVLWPWLMVLSLLVVLPASEIAVSLTNVLITTCLKPWLLPKLDFQNGIDPLERIAWRCTIWRMSIRRSPSHCSPTLPTRRRSRCLTTRPLSNKPAQAFAL